VLPLLAATFEQGGASDLLLLMQASKESIWLHFVFAEGAVFRMG
jgi:hypothetical protein